MEDNIKYVSSVKYFVFSWFIEVNEWIASKNLYAH